MNLFIQHNRFIQRFASVFILGASLFFVGCAKQEESNQKIKEAIITEFAPKLQVSEDNMNVIVKGVSGFDDDGPYSISQFLSVYVIEEGSMWDESDSPILGNFSYVREKGQLVFAPKYPFLENTEYYARFDYNAIVHTPVFVEQPNMQFVEEYTFVISSDKTPVTFVEEVYPTTDQVPRNLLKFYVQFSGSMTEGEMLNNVRVLDENGKVVEHAFLEIPQELWDGKRERLTILFDPGRIKRGMELLDEVGAPFEIGKSYSLQIDQDWKDGQDRTLTQNFEKEFTVIDDDRSKPDEQSWELVIPKKGTKDRIEIHFKESLDFALLQRAITIWSSKNREIIGLVELEQNETGWTFKPDKTWDKGSYSIKIESILEDLAGNNLISVFDVDLENEEEKVDRKKTPDYVELHFKID